MQFTFDIDVGGTFTDCFVCFGSDARLVKTPTTYYDLSVCFMNALEEGAQLFGLSLQEALLQTSAIRYSTTIGTNSLIERNGPKLGVLTTAGFEDTIYIGRSRQWADGIIAQENRDVARIEKPKPLIERSQIVGLNERVDSFGQVVIPLQREEVLKQVQYLVDQGVTGIVVGLLWAFKNPAHEQMVKTIIEEEYPDSYLGRTPVFLSSEISAKTGEYGRIMTAIVSLYIHQQLADQISDIGEKLRDLGYVKPLMLVHNTGGMKKVSRTKAILTHNAGPVSGLYGSLYVGKLYDERNIIFTDMGGTSYDIGIMVDQQIPADSDFVIDRWRTQIHAVQTKSIGAGGGSIAWINEAFGNLLEVGPMSARAMPGPAAYDLGGTEPTVTDADIVLGYLNPEYYLGGNMQLNYDLAYQAIREKIAEPLGIDVVTAAARIRKIVDARMGQEIYKEVALRGHDPHDFVLFAGGGAGALHCCGFNEHIETPRIMTCPYSPIFGAFGASTMNIMHLYEKSSFMKLTQYGKPIGTEVCDRFNEIVHELKEQANRDLQLEGFDPQDITYTLELEMKYGSQLNATKITSSLLFIHSADDVREIADTFSTAYSDRYSAEAAYPAGGIVIEAFILRAEIEVPHYPFIARELETSSPEQAIKGMRDVYWLSVEQFVATPVYDYEKLRPGHCVAGPAIIESASTTYAVETNYTFTIDTYGNGIFDRLGAPSTEQRLLQSSIGKEV